MADHVYKLRIALGERYLRYKDEDLLYYEFEGAMADTCPHIVGTLLTWEVSGDRIGFPQERVHHYTMDLVK